jgi:hypothetical protein
MTGNAPIELPGGEIDSKIRDRCEAISTIANTGGKDASIHPKI